MKHDHRLHEKPDYRLFWLDQSNNFFRGPKPDFGKPYIAFLGSTETFGKFVQVPFVERLERELKIPCASFSKVNAGIDMVFNDAAVQLACSGAEVTVIAAMPAHNMSNRLYRVHPRHNDRFIDASPMIRHLFPNLDTSRFHYTRHLLTVLKKEDEGGFDVVVRELQKAWVARVKLFLDRLEGRKVFLWAGNQAPPEAGALDWEKPLGPEPLFVDQGMVDQISPLVTKVVEFSPSNAALSAGKKGMIIHETEKLATEEMPGPTIHKEIAQALLGPLKAIVQAKKSPL